MARSAIGIPKIGSSASQPEVKQSSDPLMTRILSIFFLLLFIDLVQFLAKLMQRRGVGDDQYRHHSQQHQHYHDRGPAIGTRHDKRRSLSSEVRVFPLSPQRPQREDGRGEG